MDVGLLLLRLLLGGVLFVHGMQKATGWFSGPGLAGAEALFAKIGQEPPGLKVRMAIACELGAAISLILGVAAPLGAALAASTMLVAGVSLTLTTKKLWLASGGGEYPLVLAVLAVVIGFTGPGRYSVDWLVELDQLVGDSKQLIGTVVVVVALVGAVPPSLSTRNALSRKARTTANQTGDHA